MLFWRKREPQSPRDHAQRGPILLATERHLLAAYRMVLGREPDGEGWAHYRERVRQGLRLDDLLTEFVNSTEYIEREQREQAVRTSPPAGSEPDVIDPSDVMRRYSPAQLAETADEYYRRVTDPIPLMRKPFAFLHETPEMLQNLGSLFAGLELGKSMTVLDFGAGTCWLSG